MSRLPVPGQDEGTWGAILNEYLTQTLASDGQLKAGSVGTTQLQDASVTSAKLSSAVQTSLAKADDAVLTVNGQTPDGAGNVTVPAGPQGPQGIQGEEGPEGPEGPQGVPGQDGADGIDGTNGTNGADGTSVTVTLVTSANWPPPNDPDPLHWYVKVP